MPVTRSVAVLLIGTKSCVTDSIARVNSSICCVAILPADPVIALMPPVTSSIVSFDMAFHDQTC